MDIPLLLYGAYGYTGELIAQLAHQKGLRLHLAGRDEARTAALAERLDMPYSVFDLRNSQALEAALGKVGAVLHAAGPFSATAQPMVEACLHTKTHYLDITGEIAVFEWIAQQHARAVKAGISLLPGAGFDVVPSDCLAAFLYSQLPDAHTLELGFKAIGQMSRGTTLTMVENLPKGGMIRQNSLLKTVGAAHEVRLIPELDPKHPAVAIPWGDVSTAFHSTGIPNITVYMVVPSRLLQGMRLSRYTAPILGLGFVQNFLKNYVRKRITGPDEHHRNNSHSVLWGKVTNAEGQSYSALLHTPEGYALTAQTALEIALRMLQGDTLEGFLTPSKAFGADFILQFEGVRRQLLA
ncbi:saccharopine dehydrogenase family protein [Eisenibacter elegans]|uniref:saccharopine dehydrogenase family protein n=1 Tax=Eisenibacter elegans TaxID=997 RepID=UPI0004109113|nr:saccharopine dehydrogenase NADP-binding domain-containing protein [Eisenibacter elegans]